MNINDMLAMLRTRRETKAEATGMVEALAEYMSRNFGTLSAVDAQTLGQIGAVLAEQEFDDAWNLSADVAKYPKLVTAENPIMLALSNTPRRAVRRVLSEQAMQSIIQDRQDTHPECDSCRFTPVSRQPVDSDGCNWAVPSGYTPNGLEAPACTLLMAKEFHHLRASFNLESA